MSSVATEQHARSRSVLSKFWEVLTCARKGLGVAARLSGQKTMRPYRGIRARMQADFGGVLHVQGLSERQDSPSNSLPLDFAGQFLDRGADTRELGVNLGELTQGL